MRAAARSTTATRPPRGTIGPEDAGLRMTWEEFDSAQWEEGYRYELIDGRLVVAPAANPKHSKVWEWLNTEFVIYRREHGDVIGHFTAGGRVFIPGRPDVTVPEPDFACYDDMPTALVESPEFDWRKVSPFLVIEVISPDSVDKDLFRNVELYELVPSIREYWIVDPREGINQRTLRVYRRRGRKWLKPIDIGPGGEYTTKLLPGFCLRLDPLA